MTTPTPEQVEAARRFWDEHNVIGFEQKVECIAALLASREAAQRERIAAYLLGASDHFHDGGTKRPLLVDVAKEIAGSAESTDPALLARVRAWRRP